MAACRIRREWWEWWYLIVGGTVCAGANNTDDIPILSHLHYRLQSTHTSHHHKHCQRLVVLPAQVPYLSRASTLSTYLPTTPTTTILSRCIHAVSSFQWPNHAFWFTCPVPLPATSLFFSEGTAIVRHLPCGPLRRLPARVVFKTCCVCVCVRAA